MKLFLFLVLLVFSAFLVSANQLEFEFTQNNYFKEDTLQVWINASDDIQEEIKHTDLGLLKEGNEVTVYPYLIKLSDKYYFAYYKLPSESGQYSFLVKNLLYFDNGVLKSEDFTSDFNIADDVSIGLTPGIFKVNDLNRDYVFQLFVKNNKDSSVNVEFSKSKDYTFLGSSGFSLNSGQTKILDIFFDHTFVGNVENDAVTVSIGGRTYEIPIWLGFETEVEIPEDVPDEPVNDTPINNGTNQTEPVVNQSIELTGDIRFVNQYAYLNETLGYGEKTQGSLFFRNYANSTVEDISFIFTGNLNQIAKLNTYFFDSIAPNEINKTFLIINQEGGADPGEYTGSVRLLYGDKKVDFPVNIIIEDQEVAGDDQDVDDGFLDQNVNSTDSSPYDDFGTNYTSTPDSEETNEKTWLWVLLSIVGIIAVVLFVIYKFKMKKNEPTLFGQQ